MLIIREIEAFECITDPMLRQLAKRASNWKSREFVAEIEKCEVAFLCYEDWSDRSLGFVHTLFVLPEHRGRGIGPTLLSYAEAWALSLQCIRIQLQPHPIDHSIELDWVRSWYAKQGYVQNAHDSSTMEKVFSFHASLTQK